MMNLKPKIARSPILLLLQAFALVCFFILGLVVASIVATNCEPNLTRTHNGYAFATNSSCERLMYFAWETPTWLLPGSPLSPIYDLEFLAPLLFLISCIAIVVVVALVSPFASKRQRTWITWTLTGALCFLLATAPIAGGRVGPKSSHALVSSDPELYFELAVIEDSYLNCHVRYLNVTNGPAMRDRIVEQGLQGRVSESVRNRISAYSPDTPDAYLMEPRALIVACLCKQETNVSLIDEYVDGRPFNNRQMWGFVIVNNATQACSGLEARSVAK